MEIALRLLVADRVIKRAVERPRHDLAMERYARGDEAAFAEVYDAVAPRLYAFLLRQTRSDARAKDVLQQTFLKIHLARGSFAAGAAVLPWAYAIARRLWIDSIRRGRREVLLEPDGAEPADDLPPDAAVYSAEIAGRVRRVLERLPQNQRVAFQLVKEEELSMAEAAAVLGTSEAAVKLRAHRAYQALRAELGDLAPGARGEGVP